MKIDLLAIAAHPDDLELSAAGTILKHKDLGYKVGVLDLTRGELGTRGTPEIRKKEAQRSSEIGDIDVRANVGLPDGFFQNNEKNIRKIIPYLRKYRPDIVLINAKWDRHPDHARSSQLAKEACFYSGLVKIETTDPETGDPQDRWRPRAMYQYLQDYTSTPDIVVDISDYIDKKMEMIKAFKSQFYDPESKELNTPLSDKSFFDLLLSKDRVMGRFIGADFGEGFHITRPMGVRDLMKTD
jgi:bacillithiol biosynthesis deacetylase BshB1